MDEVSRFFDVETQGPVQIQIEQDGERFKMLRKLGYRDPSFPGRPFIVPKDLRAFRTDLASIPWFFAWLVPGYGSHLPAVLLHDGLIRGPGQPPEHEGPDVDRVEADRILRDAMANLGTPRIRRWIMWAAVTLATAAASRPIWKWWGRLVLMIGTVLVLGTLATMDLFDVIDPLPWMGHRVWWKEVVGWGDLRVAHSPGDLLRVGAAVAGGGDHRRHAGLPVPRHPAHHVPVRPVPDRRVNRLPA